VASSGEIELVVQSEVQQSAVQSEAKQSAVQSEVRQWDP
jgi:hypothetical protein